MSKQGDNTEVRRARELVDELTDVVDGLTDLEVGKALGDGILDNFVRAILDPAEVSEHSSIADFFLENRNRAALLAALRVGITRYYSYEVEKEGQTGYAAPSHHQWYEDAVMLLEGTDRFQGHIARYNGDTIEYMTAGREIEAGENVGPEDVEWISLEEVRKRLVETSASTETPLQSALGRLENMLEEEVNDENEYQELLEEAPWAFEARFKEIQRHEALDDENIPDFTGVRVKDDFHDIIEIKPPFTNYFKDTTGELNANFKDAWGQAIRYLRYAERNRRGLLEEKGLRFDSPECYLVLGYNFNDEERKKLLEWQKGNRALIHVVTYDELDRMMRRIIDLGERASPSQARP